MKIVVRLLSVLRDEDVILAARDEATALVEADPQLVDEPGLARAVSVMLDEERAEFLEKS